MPSPYQRDIDALTRIISLPAQPISARWQATEKGTQTGGIGPTDYEVVAVLEYDVSTIRQLEAQMVPQVNPAELYVAKDFVKQWFPTEVQESFAADSLYPEYLKLNATRYQPLPFSEGSLRNGYVFIAGNQVFVYLHTM